jgi:hypothetical protein
MAAAVYSKQRNKHAIKTTRTIFGYDNDCILDFPKIFTETHYTVFETRLFVATPVNLQFSAHT